MSVIDATNTFNKVNDPLNPPDSLNTEFKAAALAIPKPLAELVQSDQKMSFGNSRLAAGLVAGLGDVSYIDDMATQAPALTQKNGLNA